MFVYLFSFFQEKQHDPAIHRSIGQQLTLLSCQGKIAEGETNYSVYILPACANSGETWEVCKNLLYKFYLVVPKQFYFYSSDTLTPYITLLLPSPTTLPPPRMKTAKELNA